MKMPVIFVGHGAPTNALEDNAYTRALGKLGRELPRPLAVLCVSAHWITEGTRVLASEKPRTIHDFQGFPPELYQVRYPAPGAPMIAERLASKLECPTDVGWGLDHGTWSVLIHMFPKADIPVFQLSLDASKTFTEHLELGKELYSLREEGVLVLGSGNLTHNLGRIVWDMSAEPVDWAVEFDAKAKKAIGERDLEYLVEPSSWGGELFRKAHPTPDHYIPLLYAMGASKDGDQLTYPHEGFQYGSLSMRMARWG